MQRIVLFKTLSEEDKKRLEALLINEPFHYDISLASKSITLDGDNDLLAYVKRLLFTNHFELL